MCIFQYGLCHILIKRHEYRFHPKNPDLLLIVRGGGRTTPERFPGAEAYASVRMALGIANPEQPAVAEPEPERRTIAPPGECRYCDIRRAESADRVKRHRRRKQI